MKLQVIIFYVVYILHYGYGNFIRRSCSRNCLKERLTEPRHVITIPVIIHLDKPLRYKLFKNQKFNRKKLKDFSRNILNEAELLLQHSSLNQSFNLILRDTKFLRSSTVPLEENSSLYLKRYCNWQAHRKAALNKWWYSILLTGINISQVNGRGERNNRRTGLSYTGGLCTTWKSCSLLEWNPKNVGSVMAHELGHSLGIAHDGPPHNSCKPFSYIMSSKHHPLYYPKSWSRCSRNDLQKFIVSRKGWCIQKINFKKL